MNNIQKLLENKKHFKISAVIFALMLVLFFNPVSDRINHTLQGFFQRLSGESIPNSNIVIIKIDAHDIEKLGSWPLKRSYYALLLNNLNQYEVKGVGLEIFLSDNLSFQSVYNQLLNEQIRKTKNVVLSSHIISLIYDRENTTADSILYPQPKINNNNVRTGHLHFQENIGVFIPTIIKLEDSVEKSFALEIAEIIGFENNSPELIKLNLDTSWKNYKNYSLLEFFELAERKDKSLSELKNKFIMIGVSDPSTAKFISSPFDEQLPGIGLHAIIVDNLLNDKFLNSNFVLLSALIYFLLFLFIAYKDFANKDITCCVFVLFFCMITSFIIFTYFQIELNYSAFLLPFAFLVLSELLIHYWESKYLLSAAISETEILKIALSKKENHLAVLEEKFKSSKDKNDKQLIEQISTLKKEISELEKSREDDRKPETGFQEAINFYGIIYRSKLVENVVKTIEKVAPTEASILILGESGSGKELAAQAIHKLSKRSGKNFLAINCAAVSDSLLESELFGHKKGAFTNAVADKKGMFEAADNGTIFLDEIGETSENFQVKLLRVLQSGEIQKVGDTQNIFVNVRIIAATNKNLEELVKQKLFREDLYYRLNVIQLKLPSLRERKEDIKILANYFVKKEDPKLSISKAVINQLERNDWKGNVRELESIIKRA
jgi:transcriptional regulator with AAA-type ATPase domain